MRILIVEDQRKMANFIQRGLKEEKYAVDVAHDAEKAIYSADINEYDLIILDRLLPEMDGIEIAKKLRGQKIHTPILMLTAKGQISDKVEGLDAGADDYLIKPFAFEELLARVRALARRPKESVGTTLSIDDLTLDTTSYEVARNGKMIKLSSKEYALLQYLMRHANKILTKDQIISHVWNYEADVLPNTVEVYIGYLRNKIDKQFPKKSPLIQTARGFGYKVGRRK